jgi:acetyltransferase-like isoleucine patch superfamily enzyme
VPTRPCDANVVVVAKARAEFEYASARMVDESGGCDANMNSTKEKIWKVVRDPLLFLYLLNAQLRMALWAKVPLSVRLRGRIRIVGGGNVTFGNGVMLIGNVVPIEIISLGDGCVTIGEQTFINYGTSISAHQEVTIGKRCKIGHYVFMMDNNQHDVLDRTKLPASSPIVVEDDVWIGAHSIILPGVRIGRHSVVGAGSIVTADVPPDCLVAGNPATIKRKLRAEGAA